MDSRVTWGDPTFPTTDSLLRRASYPVESGSIRVVPTVVYLPSSGDRMPGVVSLGVERSAPGDPLHAKAEFDWSGRSGGSFELGYVQPGRSVTIRGADRPWELVSMLDGRAPGKALDGAWVERLDARTTATLSLSNDRLDLDGRDPQNTAGRVEVSHRATEHISVLARMSSASYSDSAALDMRRATLSFGTTLEAGAFGMTATYRDEENSWTAGGGRGARVAVRGAQGGWSASVFADVQQQAATLELEIRGQPDLPADLADVGLVAASPESAVQTLRDRPALIAQHGVAFGALRVDPLRVQSGVDLRWRDSGAQRTSVGVRLAYDDVDATIGARRAVLGSLYASWRMPGETDVSASYSNWSMQRDFSADDNRSMFRVLVRAPL